MTAAAITCGQNFARSAMPPEMMAGTAAAKVARKKNFTSEKPCGAKGSPPPARVAALGKKVTP